MNTTIYDYHKLRNILKGNTDNIILGTRSVAYTIILLCPWYYIFHT